MNGLKTFLGRHHGWTLALAVTLLGAGMLVGSVATAPAAEAYPFGLCDASDSLPMPMTPLGTTNGVTFTKTHADSGDTIIVPTADQKTPIEQYAGGGLRFKDFDLGLPCDEGTRMQVGGFNAAFVVLTEWPARLLGVVLQWSFSTMVTDWLLQQAKGVVTAMTANVWGTWAPLAIFFVMLVAIFQLATGKARRAWQNVAWALAVTGAVGLFATHSLGVMQGINDLDARITNCVTFAVAEGGCATNSKNSTSQFTDGMVEILGHESWGVGVLDKLADEPVPTELKIVAHDKNPSFGDNAGKAVVLPVEAIPSLTGTVTWAEAWRWSGTYTNAEMAAIAGDASLGCSGTSGPTTSDMSNPGSDAAKKTGSICTEKALLRTALLSTLYQVEPGIYLDATGQADDSMLSSAIAGIGVWPLVIGEGAIGVLLFLYGVEFLFLFLSAPIVALISLWSRRAIRKWFEQIAAVLVRRIAVGLVLGMVLWATSGISAGILKFSSFDGPSGTVSVLAMFTPILTTLSVISLMIGGYMLLGKLRDMMLSSFSLETGHGFVVDGAKKATKVAAELAIAGVSGGAAALAVGGMAGTGRMAKAGAVFKGAAQGMFRSNGGFIGRAMRAGDMGAMRGDMKARRVEAEEERAARRTEQVRRDTTRADRSWRDGTRGVFDSVEAQNRRADRIEETTLAANAATRNHEKLAAQRAAFDTDPAERARIAARTDELATSGMVRDQARAQALTEHQQRAAALDQHVAAARVQVDVAVKAQHAAENVTVDTDTLVQQVADALRKGATADQIADRLGVGEQTRHDIRRMEDAHQLRLNLRTAPSADVEALQA